MAVSGTAGAAAPRLTRRRRRQLVLLAEYVVFAALVVILAFQADWGEIHTNFANWDIAKGLFPDVVTSGEERVRQTHERAKTVVPLGRPGKLREAGYLALYLASAASDYMTGQTLVLDGGLGL